MALPSEEVLSEVHMVDCPPACGWWSTVFRVRWPTTNDSPSLEPPEKQLKAQRESSPVEYEIDSDGDLEVPRRPPGQGDDTQIVIRHFGATPLLDVGLQVWRGSLLLADLALHLRDGVEGKVCVELGSGTGLTGLLLARRGASRVFVTDVGGSVLDNCQANVDANRRPTDNQVVKVRELDWQTPPSAVSARKAGEPFSWTTTDLEELHCAETLFAGDCIYDDDRTNDFLRCLWRLMTTSRRPTLYLAMEKRWNFTLTDMESRAPAFDHFMRQLGLPQSSASELSEGRSHAHTSEHRILTTSLPASSPFFQNPLHCTAADVHVLHAMRLSVYDVPQRIAYERGKDLELWCMQLLPYQGSCCQGLGQ